MLPLPKIRRGPSGPTTSTQPKTMAERVNDVKGRMGSGPPTGPVINRPVSRPPTGPMNPGPMPFDGFDADRAYPDLRLGGARGPGPMPPNPGPVINRPVSRPPTGPMNPGPMPPPPVGGGMKRGGKVKSMSSGGSTSKSSSASKRGDGIAQRGKTKGRMC